ncbi:MAG TPA: ABC transporter substrate-binding protein [Pseudonocardiaceae bacterium]|jgi:polar amino acid transport system substrate-binding protein|nr:ABC transporter substrate-binding protein [Pseudonocardiaceae bacterium]
MAPPRLRRLALSVIPVALAAFLITACGSSGGSSAGDNKLGLIQPGTITAAITAGGAPFASVDANGQPVGLLIDLNNAIAKNLGVKIVYKQTDVNGAFSGITANRYDVLAIGLVDTPAREKSVNFTKPIYYGTNVVLVPKSSSVTSPAQLAGKRVGASAASTQYDYAQAALKGAQLISEASNSAGISQLSDGNLDAYVGGGTQIATLMNQAPGKFKIAFTAPQTSPGAIGMNKKEAAFEAAYNTQLANLINDGTFLKIYNKFFASLNLPFPPGLYKFWPTLQKQVQAAGGSGS